jgi:hypothetical protein
MDTLNKKEEFYSVFTEDLYNTIDQIVKANDGINKYDLVEKINIKKFTIDSLNYILEIINSSKNTFYGVCGPFVIKDDNIFLLNKEKYTILRSKNRRERERLKSFC